MPSTEYLQSFLDKAKGYLPKWLINEFHKAARATAGGKSKNRVNKPSVLEKLAIEDITPSQLRSMPKADLRLVWLRLHQLYSRAQRKKEPVEGFVNAALFVMQEMQAKDVGFSTDTSLGEAVLALRRTNKDNVKKGFINGDPEGGVHAHTLLRNKKKTLNDGAHLHFFVLPDDSTVLTVEDGEHEHGMDSQAGTIVNIKRSAHKHKVILDDGAELFTEVDGEHTHTSDMLETTNFDGAHKHKLILLDGTEITSLNITEFWEQFGPFDLKGLPPMPPASTFTRALIQKQTELKRIPAIGNKNSIILFVGSSPSRIEADSNRPLVGPIGETLSQNYLVPLGLNRSDVAITNAVPVILEDSNGAILQPTDDQIEQFKSILSREITRLKPNLVVALGEVAEKALGDKADFVLPHPDTVGRLGRPAGFQDQIKELKAMMNKVSKETADQLTEDSINRLIAASMGFKTITSKGKNTIRKEITIVEKKDDKQIAYGIVMEADTFDAQKDRISEDELEKAAHFFMENKQTIGFRHKRKANAKLVESMVLRKGDVFNELKLQHASWIIGVHVENKSLWKDIKAGKIKSFSVGGFAKRVSI